MSEPLTKKTADYSRQDTFQFGFFCDNCGKEWKSQPVQFTTGGLTTVEFDDAMKLLWAHERRTALEQANLDARMKFNRCANCGEWVCDDCFDQDEKKQDGLCAKCNGKRN